ncbi:MAG: hypothetical protein RRB24_02080, partial [Armatimonadota bacterium]|nr:hypothetical protein [Armatimonadota bacterium]
EPSAPQLLWRGLERLVTARRQAPLPQPPASIAQASAIQFLCVAICSRLASLLFCVANFGVSVKREGEGE